MRLAAILAMALFAGPLVAQNFTTAAQVRPILQATKAQWIAVRLWQGQDLLYFTSLLSWRCGLETIRYRVNDGDETVLGMEPCYSDTATPNALKLEDILPYVVLEPDSISRISVTVIFDDGEELTEVFERAAVQIN